MKNAIKLKDKDGVIAFIEIEVTHRNKYPELSICGEYAGGHGQVYDHIKPATKLQTKLLKFWKTKHLKKVSEKEQEQIAKLVEELQAEFEEQRGEQLFSEMDEDEAIELIEASDENFSNPEKVLALAIEEGVTVNELGDITEDNDTSFSYGGREYLVCTDDEADTLHDEDMENYLDELILPELPETAQRDFDREAWKSDAKMDGRGNSLGRYDGNENEQRINGTTYFLYRQ